MAEFFDCIKQGELEKVKTMIETIDINQIRDKKGFSPIVVACGHGEDDIVSLFISSGSSIQK